MSIISVIVIVILLITGLKFLTRISKDKTPLQMGMLFGGIHFLFVLLITVSIYFGIKSDPETVMAWFLFLIVDFPSSLAFVFLNYLLHKVHNFMLTNFYLPFLVFATLGSLQYFLIGLGVGWLLKNKNHVKEQLK